MTENLGRILDAMAFHAMSNKQLIDKIADHVVERRKSSALYHRYNRSDRQLVEHRIAELVEKFGSIGGNLTRAKLTSLVLKKIRNLRNKEYRKRWNAHQNT
ncbi:MAG TPA: hypothetical protein VM537_35245 [Anaerolineae bacterium]|jgi:hypothetical protein|nr:hypothetical protein [Anaerolineae bacterium]